MRLLVYYNAIWNGATIFSSIKQLFRLGGCFVLVSRTIFKFTSPGGAHFQFRKFLCGFALNGILKPWQTTETAVSIYRTPTFGTRQNHKRNVASVQNCPFTNKPTNKAILGEGWCTSRQRNRQTDRRTNWISTCKLDLYGRKGQVKKKHLGKPWFKKKEFYEEVSQKGGKGSTRFHTPYFFALNTCVR